jgi:hypothetical protein
LIFGIGAHGWCSSSCSCYICQWTVPSINGCCTLMATNPTQPLPEHQNHQCILPPNTPLSSKNKREI